MKIGNTERIPARAYQRMSAEERNQRVSRQVGRLAEKVHFDGLEFVYWPEVGVRWLMPADPSTPNATVDCPPGQEGYAIAVQVEVRTTARERRPARGD